MNQGKVLVILSSTSQLELQDGKVLNTGFFLNEFGIPARRLVEAGYAMTVLSNLEERLAETNMPAKLQFHIESALKKAGAKMDVAWIPQQSKVVQDRELITGQNPFSDEQLSTQFLNMLMERAHAGSQR